MRFTWLLGLTIAFAGSVSAAPINIEVAAGETDRIDVPIYVEIAGLDASGTCQLIETKAADKSKDGKERRIGLPCQIEATDPPRVWFVLNGKTPKGETRRFELTPGRKARKTAPVTVTRDDKAVVISALGRDVLQYNHAPTPPPEGKDKLYTRSAYIHPLWSTEGTEMTAIHPPDHIHHMGIWAPWTKTVFEGRDVDFWNIGKGGGTVRFVDFESLTEGPVYGGFRAKQEHVDLSAPGGEKVALNETWDVRVYNVGGPEKEYWLWDLTMIQRCASESPLELPEYRYGGMGFRSNNDWKGENALYLTSEGHGRTTGHTTRARWCEVAGKADGRWAGMVVMDHTENF